MPRKRTFRILTASVMLTAPFASESPRRKPLATAALAPGDRGRVHPDLVGDIVDMDHRIVGRRVRADREIVVHIDAEVRDPALERDANAARLVQCGRGAVHVEIHVIGIRRRPPMMVK